MNPLQSLVAALAEKEMQKWREAAEKGMAAILPAQSTPADLVDLLVPPLRPEDISDAKLAAWARRVIGVLSDAAAAVDANDETGKLSRQSILITEIALLIDDLPRCLESSKATDEAFLDVLEVGTQLTERYLKDWHTSTDAGRKGYQFKKHSSAFKSLRTSAAQIAATMAYARLGGGMVMACENVANILRKAGYAASMDKFDPPNGETVRGWAKTILPSPDQKMAAVHEYAERYVASVFTKWAQSHGAAYLFHHDLASGRASLDDEDIQQTRPPPPCPVETITNDWRKMLGPYAEDQLRFHVAEVHAEFRNWSKQSR